MRGDNAVISRTGDDYRYRLQPIDPSRLEVAELILVADIDEIAVKITIAIFNLSEISSLYLVLSL